MDIEPGVAKLPVALAAALRLRRAGADDILIARALDIDPDGVDTLIALAEAKLRRIIGQQPAPDDGLPPADDTRRRPLQELQ